MICRFIAAALLMVASLCVQAQTTTFTYQGYLTEAGTAAEGAFDFELALYNVDTGGSAIDVNAFDDVTVTGGLFELPADFTSAPFEAGGSYWVEARVRDGASTGAYTALLPRQAVNASPYAIAAQAVIAPLDVAGDANVQGELTVAGDIRTDAELRAGRVEADEIWSDGPVDLLGGAAIQRFGDNVALLVENSGPTQPALKVQGDIEAGGQLRCGNADGCISAGSLVETVLHDRAQIQFFEDDVLVVPTDIETVTASCPDADALLLFGACPDGGFGALEVLGTRIMNRSDPLQPLGYSCRYLNGFGSSQRVRAIAACLDVSP